MSTYQQDIERLAKGCYERYINGEPNIFDHIDMDVYAFRHQVTEASLVEDLRSTVKDMMLDVIADTIFA
jgi:hypothetical protein